MCSSFYRFCTLSRGRLQHVPSFNQVQRSIQQRRLLAAAPGKFGTRPGVSQLDLKIRQKEIVKLSEDLKRKDFVSFLNNLYARIVRNLDEKIPHFASTQERNEMTALLKQFASHNHSDIVYAKFLKALQMMLFFVHDRQQKQFLDEIITKYLNCPTHDYRWFGTFLWTLKKLQYNWKLLNDSQKAGIFKFLEGIRYRPPPKEESSDFFDDDISELFVGLPGIDCHWSFLPEKAQENLLTQYLTNNPKVPTTTIGSNTLNLHKLGLSLKDHPLRELYLKKLLVELRKYAEFVGERSGSDMRQVGNELPCSLLTFSVLFLLIYLSFIIVTVPHQRISRHGI
jgi:hypothetical protein